jgi:hypothetical protein
MRRIAVCAGFLVWAALGALLPSAARAQEPTQLPQTGLAQRATRWAGYYGLDPALVGCLIARESDWDPQALGDEGRALGLAQWHLGSWCAVRRAMGLPEDDLRDAPHEALRTTLWALSQGYAPWWSAYPPCVKETGMDVVTLDVEAARLADLRVQIDRAWAALGFTVRDAPPAGYDGFLWLPTRTVWVRATLPPTLQAKVHLHELAHVVLRLERLRAGAALLDPVVEEGVAELAAQDVLRRCALPPNADAQRYLAEALARQALSPYGFTLRYGPVALRAAHQVMVLLDAPDVVVKP